MKDTPSVHFDKSQIPQDTIDIVFLFTVIKDYIWRILGLTMMLTLLATLIVFSLTPLYTSKVSLLIEAETANVAPVQELYGLDSSRKEYFETQFEILRSRQIAEKTVRRLSLYENPLFDETFADANKGFLTRLVLDAKTFIRKSLTFLPQEDYFEMTESEKLESRVGFATDVLMASTRVIPKRNTQVVEVIIETADPKLSATIANTIADVYIDSYLEAKFEMTQDATEWLNNSIQGLRDRLTKAEGELEAFDESNEVVNIDGVVGLTSEKVQQLSDELIASRLKLQRDQALFEKITSSTSSIEDLSRIPEVLNHPSVQDIRRAQVIAQSNVSELQQVFGPKHPTMISANAELTSITESLDDQTRNLISGITTEYRETVRKVDSLEADLKITTTDLRRLTSIDNKRRSLERDVTINQQLYDSFFTRLNETDQVVGFESANARVLDLARPSDAPSKPNKMLIIALSLFLSFGFGCMLAVLLRTLNSGVRSVEDVERKLSQRMLGLITLEPHDKKEDLPVRYFFEPDHHTFSESVRTLRTSIQLLNVEKPPQVVVVTSSVPKEGKSTVSVNLAFAFGQVAKTLLIDADMRRPSVAKLFDLPGYQPGLANVVSGSHSIDECIVNDDEANIDILSAGSMPPNPQELLVSEKFKETVNKLKKTYDHIIIDTPPTQAVSDAITVTNHADSLVYVVKSDSTNSKLINASLSRFIEAGKRIDGIVLNQVDLRKSKSGAYYYGYYDAYGYSSQKNAETIK